ncbi:MAG: metal-dependent transcriptional regulator [Bacteroidia bacterium]
MATPSEENHLKAIYYLSLNDEGKISPTIISEALDNSPASVIDMLKKLSAKKLIHYEKRKGVKLTDKGKKAALSTVRNHRLWEVFLLEKLGYTWDKVHHLAEQLEHIHHPELADRLDKFLGFPQYDPHGNIIPKSDGKIHSVLQTKLLEIIPGKSCKVVSVKDTSPIFLQYLGKLNIGIGTPVKVIEKIAYDGSVTILVDTIKTTISQKIAENIVVLLIYKPVVI